MKTCSSCVVEKELSSFHKKGKGYNPMCKECRKVYVKSHYEKNKGSYQARSKAWKSNNPFRVIAARYSVDPLEVERIMSVGKCEICSCSENLVFDHIHESGTPRGCLCFSCNTMLGRLGDTNEQILARLELIRDYVS